MPSLTCPQSQNPRRSPATPAVLLNRPGQIRHKSGRDLSERYLRANSSAFFKYVFINPLCYGGLFQKWRKLVLIKQALVFVTKSLIGGLIIVVPIYLAVLLLLKAMEREGNSSR
jgi:hypothetical protein